MGRRASVGLLSAATLLGLAVILLLAPGAAAVPNCTSLALKQSRTPRTTSPGKRLRFTYTIRNTGATRDVALGIIIPLGVKLTKQSSTVGGLGYKHLAPVNASIIDARLRSAFQVFWPTQTLLAKKTRKYKATFEVVKCEIMPEELLFYARASEIVDNAVVCNKDFESQRVRASGVWGVWGGGGNGRGAGLCVLPPKLTAPIHPNPTHTHLPPDCGAHPQEVYARHLRRHEQHLPAPLRALGRGRQLRRGRRPGARPGRKSVLR